MLQIRYFGDTILFTPTQKVRFSPEENIDIPATIDKMMATLREQGGIGIAANQCVDIPAPVPSIIIVGIANPDVLARQQARYPNMEIPIAEVLINPRIIERSEETYFPPTGEGCLSIPCAFRGKVARHRWVVVQYQDIEGKSHEENFSEIKAHVVQHETDHLKGVVFLHRILNDMSPTQRQDFAKIIEDILADPTPTTEHSQLPTLTIDRDEHGHPIISADVVKNTLSELDNIVLQSLKQAAQ